MFTKGFFSLCLWKLGQNGILLTGGDDRCLTAWDVKSGKVAYTIEEAHPARVRGIVVLTKNSSGAFTDDDPHVVASASTDGVIRVWDVRMTAIKDKPNPLAEANTKARLTCLAGSALKCTISFLFLLVLLYGFTFSFLSCILIICLICCTLISMLSTVVFNVCFLWKQNAYATSHLHLTSFGKFSFGFFQY